MRVRTWVTGLVAAALGGCATLSAERRAALELDAAPALQALQAARFEDATAEAQRALTRNLSNSRASAVYAVALYQRTLRDFATDAVSFVSSLAASALLRGNFWNHDYLDFAVHRADERLAEVDRALSVTQEDQGFSMELCLACWAVDWDRSGEVDARDQRLLEIELDAQGARLGPDDPRRRPTFRFDWADVFWLRAMVGFQRAGLALLRAYEPELKGLNLNHLKALRLKLRDAEQVHRARELLLTALAAARDCKKALELETDDDREWVPNPRQKSHAMPLEVDQALFDTWAQVVDDVEALVRGQTGLEVAALARLDASAPSQPPFGFIDVGQLLSAPTDLVVPLKLTHDAEGLDSALSLLFGKALKRSMPPSALPQRLERMHREVERGEDTLERKLRYFLWLN